MNKSAIFLALLLAVQILSLIPFGYLNLPISIDEIEAAPIVTEQSCSTNTDYRNGTGVWSSRKCRVFDGDSWEKWYVKQGFGADDTTYQIANGKIGYELHKDFGNLTYYNINFNETRVTMEHWTVEVNTGGAWHDTLVHTVEPTISYHSNTTGLYLTMVKEKNDLRLELVHVIEEGLPMKHNLNIKSSNSTSYEYRLVQNWDGIQDATHIVQRGGNTSTTTALGSEVNSSASNGHTFIFRDGSGQDLVEESQLSARGQFHHVLYGLSGGHGYAKYYFQNAANQTLTSGQHFTVDPATASVSRDSSANYSGTWMGSGTSGSTCQPSGNPNWYDDSAHSNMQVGLEDASRCYVVKLVYDLSSIDSSATVTETSVDFTSAGVHTHYCNGSGGSSGTGSCPLVEIVYVPNSVDNCAGTTDGDVFRTGALIEDDGGVWGAEGHPHSEWEGNDIDLDSAVNAPLSTDIQAGGTACLVFSQYHSASDSVDKAGDSGGDHGFFAWNTWGLDLDITYVTTTYYDTQINLMMYDDTTNVTMGDPEVRFGSRNGTISAWTNCTKTSSGGDVGVCHLSTDNMQSGDIRMWVRWAGNGETCSSCKGLKIEGQDSYNFTGGGPMSGGGTSQMLKLQVSIYKNTTINFHDDGGIRNTPQNFTMKTGHNESSQTITSFAHDGAKTIAYTTNGTSGSENRGGSAATAADRGTLACTTLKTCNRMVTIYDLGNDRIANQTAYFNVTADHQVVSFRQKVYLLDFDFTSSNRALQSIVPSAISLGVTGNGSAILASSGEFTFSGGTLCTGVADGAGCRASGGGKFQFGNDTIVMKAIRYQGTNMVENSTGVAVSASGKHSFTLRYYPMTWLFQADGSSPAFPIVPDDFTFEGVNGSKLELDGTSDTPYIAYSGNGTINPEGVTAFGQGMIGGSQANIAVTAAASNTLNLQYYRTTFAFQSADTELTLVPSQFTFEAPNSTKRAVTDFTKYYYMGNGTLNPEGVTYLGQGMIGAAQADLTISAAATHTLSLQYYETTFVFKSSDDALTIVPEQFTFEASNGTKVFIEDWSPHDRGAGHYIGNGTINPEGVTYHDQGMIGASQANLAISAASTKTLTLQYYKQTLSFPSVDGLITITPTNFQVVLSNSTEKTLNNTGAAFPPHIYVGNGTATPRGITYQGAGVINSQTPWTVDADETITNQVQLYKKIFTFESDDLLLTITPSAFQYTAPNGTQIVQTSHFNGHANEGVYLGNGTLTSQGITYQGSGMSKNVTSITISIDSDAGTAGNQNEHLWRLRYYAIPLRFTSFDTVPDGGIQSITPEGFTFTAPNASAVCCEITDFTKTLYLGNGTVTPGGITYLDQGMIQNNTAITISQSEVMGGGFRLKLFKLNFEFQSDDLVLNITPTLFQYTAPNGTVVDQTSNYNTHFMGNGTLTQRGIKYQGTGMVKNVTTTVTVDASESHLFRMNYFTQNFNFRQTLSSNLITPTNFIMTLANGTQVTLTSYTGYYFGNQTIASIDTLTVSGLDAKQNDTGFTIASNNDSWLLWAIECCTITFNFASVGHILDDITPTTFEFDVGNGTYVTLTPGTTYTNRQFSDGDIITPRAVRFQGQNMILNSTSFTVDDATGLSQTILINMQYYKVNWDFVSVDSELDLYSTLTNFQYVAPNGTAIVQNSDFINTFLGNGTLNPVTLKFKGQGVLVNNTGITIDGLDPGESAGGGNGDETHLIRAQWYKVAFTFTSSDGALTIIPQHIQFQAPNGTVIVFTDDTDFGDHYVGNGTITPHGITYQDTGMIKSDEAAFTVSGAMTKVFALQYYKVTFDFKSWDNVLSLTPTNFKAVVANSSIPFTATHTVLYLGNGTLTPHVITWQSQNIIENMDAITIDADETHTIRGRYYAITFDFLTTAGADSIRLSGGDAPDNFIFNLGNGTEIVIENDNFLDAGTTPSAVYIANQTFTPFSILRDGTSIHENQTAISITTDENLSFRTKVYHINFLFRSSDTVLTITPDSFTFVLSNGTAALDATYVNITVPNRSDGWLLSNGTLTPNKIRFQGQNMLNSNSPITIDATETHTFAMNYYPVKFNFASTFEQLPGEAHNIVPTSMMFTPGNGTQTTGTSFTDAVYLGNQTGFRIDAINFQGSNMNHNATTITISGAGTNLLRVQYVPVKAQVHGFQDVISTALDEQIFVSNVNGTNSIIATGTNGSRIWWSGNGTLQIAPAWQNIRVGNNYSTILSSSNFYDTIGSGDGLESGGNATIIIMSSNIFEATLPDSGEVAVWFAIEDTDIACQETTRSNQTCVTFTNNRLNFSASQDTSKTLKLQLRVHSDCISQDPALGNHMITGTCLREPGSIYINNTNYQFPERNWIWDGSAKVLSFSMPFASTLNVTIALSQNATALAQSDVIIGLENSNTCLKAGDLLCTMSTPYTRAGSLGLWFYGIMMMMPVGMVWLRTASLGPTSVVMMVLIWIFGIFAPGIMGTAILPPELITFSYLFVVLSITSVLYKLLKGRN